MRCASPTLFNVYGEWIINKSLGGFGDFKVGGNNIKTFIYTYSVEYVAKTQEELYKI